MVAPLGVSFDPSRVGVHVTPWPPSNPTCSTFNPIIEYGGSYNNFVIFIDLTVFVNSLPTSEWKRVAYSYPRSWAVDYGGDGGDEKARDVGVKSRV